MTVLNFPANPSVGEQYNANGIIYTWNGSAWTASDSDDLDDRFVQLNGDTMTGNLTVPSLNSGPLSGYRNAIINGDFRVWQRGTSFPKDSSTHKYSADRWEANGTVADFSKAAAFGGFDWAIVVSNVTSGAAYIVQHIELDAVADSCQFAPGSTWTLSYWMRDNTSGAPSIDFRGDANGANQLLWTAVGAVQQIETTGVWKRYSRTFTAATYAQGQHDRATVYIPASSGANTLFTGVQLEPGPVATPFEHRPIGTELALCQRYFQTCPSQYFPGVSAKQTRWEQKITPAMRADPSVDNIGGAVGTLVSVVTRTGSVQWSYTPDSSNLFSRSFDLDAEL